MSETRTAAGGPGREWMLLLALAAVQFLHILDFVIVMPLGPRLMRSMSLSAGEFGAVVSAYTFSAAAAGLLAAAFLDRFDRRSTLLVLLAGFAVGTLLCAYAPGYGTLLAARVVAGAFGGVMAAVLFAIIGDEIPPERRGTATGVVMAGFSAASVLGLPLGLALADRWGWHAPFVLLAGLTAAVAAVVMMALPPMRGHLVAGRVHAPLRDLVRVASEPAHLRAFAVTTALVFGGFSVIPFLSPYLVGNVGVSESDLAYVYLAGGAATLFSGPLMGRLSDRFGHVRAFTAAALLSVIPILTVVHLPRVPLGTALVVTTVFMVLLSGRLIAAMALITGSVEPGTRGAFMSVNSAVQQLAAGVAASGAGLLVAADATGALHGFPRLGFVAVAATLVSLPLVRRLAAGNVRHGPLHPAPLAAPPEVAAQP